MRTDGVPLFAEEVTKSILESGTLREERGAYVFDGNLPVVAVPSSLQASLIARLDRIAPSRTVVQTSAALGREFRYAVLKAVTSLPDSELETSLNQLVASELVHQRGDVRHVHLAMSQDAAYDTVEERTPGDPSPHRRSDRAGIPGYFEHHPMSSRITVPRQRFPTRP